MAETSDLVRRVAEAIRNARAQDGTITDKHAALVATRVYEEGLGAVDLAIVPRNIAEAIEKTRRRGGEIRARVRRAVCGPGTRFKL